MRGWVLIRHLRGLIGLGDGEAATTEHVERLLDVVEGLTLEEARLSAPYLYVFGNGRGVIRAPEGWSRRITDHDALLEEILHYVLKDYADGTCTTWGERQGHRREESRASYHALLWWFFHAGMAGLDDEELARSAGRPLVDVARFRAFC